jgi:hypothetical protein
MTTSNKEDRMTFQKNDSQTRNTSHSPECFIVMPFGKKPGSDGRTYDFDKVYRVIIQRAVNGAGMRPVRSDERIGSRLIHSDMFEDLRDRAVVLADLSLENPNVFYELGVRHVMSPSGTVLMCRKGTEIPFDVRLSRVVFYKFDGEDLDWEEAEETIKNLKLALEDATHGKPDSPVHVLLENVLPTRMPATVTETPRYRAATESVNRYEQAIAEAWRNAGLSLDGLLEEHRDTIFGLRALGYFCRDEPELPTAANRVAAFLSDAEQYSLANEIFQALKSRGRLAPDDLLRYASSYSEANPDLLGAEAGIVYATEALEEVRQLAEKSADRDEGTFSEGLGQCYRRIGGLQEWKWQLTQDNADLVVAIETFETALAHMKRIRPRGGFRQVGLIAQAHLKLLLMLRTKDSNVERPDLEGHRDAILKISERTSDHPVGLSYLHWFQAITLADLGAGEESHSRVLDQLARDAKLMTNPEYFEIGRRQYVLLRRFIQQHGHFLRNPELMNLISRDLYVGLRECV